MSIPSDNYVKERWLAKFKKDGALFIHDGNPLRPHCLLTKGGHSDGFVNTIESTKHPGVLNEACANLLQLLELSADLPPPDLVAGPAIGAVPMAYDLAQQLATDYGWTEEVIEKGALGEERRTIELKRFDLKPGASILGCEDALTSGDSTRQMIDGLKKKGGVVLPWILVLFNRSGMTHLDGREIIALVHHPLNNWKPEDCPLCKAGSKAVRPKANWAALNAEY